MKVPLAVPGDDGAATLAVPFFDAARAAHADEERLTTAFLRVLRSGRYILGAEVEAFERDAATYLGVAHAIGVSSGTDALLVALAALGVGRDDEVIVPAYGFVATAEVVVRLGATPVFVDVARADLNLDPAAAARCIGPRTRAIIAVHLFGAPADVAALSALGPPVVEDAAQAFGALTRGARVGTLGRVGCFSFFPTKNLGGLGDAGLVATNDAAFASRVRTLRSHGRTAPDVYAEVGGNFRMDALHAALLAARLPAVDAALERRRRIAARYLQNSQTNGDDLATLIEPLASPEGSTFNQFVVRARTGERDALRARLAARGVATQIYYPAALPDQPCFAGLAMAGAREAFPNAREAASTTLALPCFPELTEGEVDRVCAALREVT